MNRISKKCAYRDAFNIVDRGSGNKPNSERMALSRYIIQITISVLICLWGCSERPAQPEIIALSDEQAELETALVESEVSVDLAEGLEVSLWASEIFLGDPITIDMDHQGRAWVTVTNRSSGSEIDIRGAPGNWLLENLTWTSVEDRRDFLRTELAPERGTENTWLPDYNEDGSHDWRDLTVMKEEVWRIEDLTGNGLANQSQLFIRDFHEEITDVAGAIAWYDGELFLGVGPDMWRIRDTNNDGMGDTKESISHGYNVHIGYSGHGMSGLTVGPDGRLYWAIGDMGFNVTDKEGNHWYYPDQGAILRSEPDGSNFEVFATGLRNTHEFVFDKYGNLISVDNDGNLEGEFDRLVHLTDGSDSGWRIHWQFGKHSDPLNNVYHDPLNNDYNVWRDEEYFRPRFDEQAAHILPPVSPYHNGPAGMAWNPGTALDENWRDHFFVMSFQGSLTTSAVYAFTLREKGASFELETDQQVLQGILAVGLDFGPDGALYMTDWIEGWLQKDKGRIWKLDASGNRNSSRRIETKELLAGDFTSAGEEELAQWMQHEDMRVRQKAQFELAKRADTQTLLSVISNSGHQLTRVHGIWGIGQIARRNDLDAADHLLQFLDDQDAEIRAQVLKTLGDVRYEPAAESIILLLGDEHPRVRYFAAEALGRIGCKEAVQPIVEMLEANDDEDIYLRQGGVIAFARIGDAGALADLSTHPSRAVRVAAVAALKRLEDPAVTRFLHDEDEFVAANAARAINDDNFIHEIIPHLARLLEETQFVWNEPLIRRSVNASLYNGDESDAVRLAAFSNRKDVPAEMRVEALHTLSVWEKSSLFDRVTGQYRGRVSNDPEDARNALDYVFDDIVTDADNSSEIKVAVIDAAGALNYSSAIPVLAELISSADAPEVRTAVLNALHVLDYDHMHDAVAVALNDPEESVRMNALRMISDLDLPEERIIELLVISAEEDAPVVQRQIAFERLGSMQNEAANSILTSHLDLLLTGELAPEVQLDLINAVEQSGDPDLNGRLEQYRMAKPDNILARFSETLKGGDATPGGEIFYRHPAAECIRCHAVNGQGGEAGPDLAGVGSRLTREEILQSLVDPSARLTPGFSAIVIELNNGETVRGIFLEETDSAITVSQGGDPGGRSIQKSDIRSRTNAVSAMPAMGNLLTGGQIRDLVEYLTTLTMQY